MKHIPWTVIASEVVGWGILLGIPLIWFVRDFSIETSLLLAGCWSVWAWIHFVSPRILITRSVSLPQIGSESLRIVLISDLHAGPYKKRRYFARVVRRINKQKPDIVLIPGDFLLGTAEKFVKHLAPLRDLYAPTFYTLGNHDHWVNDKNGIPAGKSLLRKKLKEFGLKELKNESLEWLPGIWLAGVDDNHFGNDDVPRALKGVKRENTILLAHSPDIVDRIEGAHPALIVCGHTHGGQLSIPWLLHHVPSLVTITRREFIWGWFRNENMFVTMGVGESGSRARWWAWPEVVVLDCIEKKS